MEERVEHLVDTIGNIAGANTSFDGQANTETYTSDAEKFTKVNADRGERTFAQKWEEAPDRSVLGVDQ